MSYREIYRETDDTGENGLAVGIGRDGLRVVECRYIGDADAPYLKITGHFTWPEYRARYRGYSGDDGSGRMRDRLVAGAISLLAYWGGEEELVDSMDLD